MLHRRLPPAYLVLFGAAMASAAVAQNPILTQYGFGAKTRYAYAVVEVGDIDGDGFLDSAVGALHHGTGGAVFVMSGRDGSTLLTVSAPLPTSGYGGSIAGPGDVDGDGTPDLLLMTIPTTAGGVDVISGRSGARLYHVPGDGDGDLFGNAMSGVGDVDGDGCADFVVGAPENGNPVFNYGPGYAKLISGRQGTVLATYRGREIGYEFGNSVAGLGDIDRDGVPDFAVGAYLETMSTIGQGSVRVYSGRTRQVLFTFGATREMDHFSIGLASPGDVDGDGYRDILVGAINAYRPSKGTVSLFSGRNGSRLLHLTGLASSGLFGMRVAGVGDIDGDGLPDFAASDPGDKRGEATVGSVRLFSGRDGSRLGVLWGDQTGGGFGVPMVSTDVDGDGRLELLVGAPGASSAGRDGRAQVWSLFPTTRVGAGCAPGSPPRLDGTRARTGSNVTLLLTNAAVRAIGVLVVSPAPGLPLQLTPLCAAYLDPAQAYPVALQVDATGSWSASYPVPQASVLVGQTFAAQGFLATSSGFDASNGLYLTVGG